MLPVTLTRSTYRPMPIPLHRWSWNVALRSHTVCGCDIHRCQRVMYEPPRSELIGHTPLGKVYTIGTLASVLDSEQRQQRAGKTEDECNRTPTRVFAALGAHARIRQIGQDPNCRYPTIPD